jgi:hypothetical protein
VCNIFIINCSHTQTSPPTIIEKEPKKEIVEESKIIPNKILDRVEINNTLKNIWSEDVTHNDVDGVWFAKESAERLLFIIEKTLPTALDLIDLQINQIKALRLAVKSYKESVNWYIEYADYNRQMLDVALKNLKNFQQPQYAWYEDRIAVYVYGILTATTILLTSAYLLDQIQP